MLFQTAFSLCLNIGLLQFQIVPSSSTVATTPPRGWNSYDSYNWIINESQVLANAQAIKQYLAPSGYEYVVIDFLWFQDIDNPSHLYVDQYGRLQPDPKRYPHSADGSGLKWIGDQIHNLGLKFGLHVMRGISSTAVRAKSPVYGASGVTADQIVQANTQCGWYTAVSSVDMSKNGAQQFENSLYAQYAEWGVDFIKNDCVYGADYVLDQIRSVSTAITNSKREMVYSLSPGNYGPPTQHAQQTHTYTNTYRLTGDDWDNYGDVTAHFTVVAQHAAAGLIGAAGHNGLSWPDSDMLPFGYITSPGSTRGPYKMTSLSKGQQRIQFSLWCISRSPLMFGGEVMALQSDAFTLGLLTNKMALSVNIESSNNRQLASSTYDRSGNPVEVKWAAAQSGGKYYVAFFNVAGNSARNMNATLSEITNNNGLKSCQSTDIWTGKTANYGSQIIVSVASQDTTFLVLQNCS